MNSARKLGDKLGPGVWWRLALAVAMLTAGLAGTILLVRSDSTQIADSPAVSSSVRLPTGPTAVTAQELQEAILRWAAAARPDAASAYAALAEVYRKAGDLKQARRWAEESVRWEPSVEAYQRLAEICRESGDRRSAQAAQQEAHRLRVEASHGP